jgi:hypothetical protein
MRRFLKFWNTRCKKIFKFQKNFYTVDDSFNLDRSLHVNTPPHTRLSSKLPLTFLKNLRSPSQTSIGCLKSYRRNSTRPKNFWGATSLQKFFYEFRWSPTTSSCGHHTTNTTCQKTHGHSSKSSSTWWRFFDVRKSIFLRKIDFLTKSSKFVKTRKITFSTRGGSETWISAS